MINRRTFLSTSSLAAVRLAPVHVSWDRVIRTTVGLRPHRDGGFVLRADRLDDKTLIHNDGHGGAGMSISWGTGAMAADLALAHQDRRAAVIGCGVVGLTAARQLQRRGFDVTISRSSGRRCALSRRSTSPPSCAMSSSSAAVSSSVPSRRRAL